MLKNFDYDKTPVVEVVNEILVDSSKRGASDIHFDPLEDYMRIRIRIDGTLIDYAKVPNSIRKNFEGGSNMRQLEEARSTNNGILFKSKQHKGYVIMAT